MAELLKRYTVTTSSWKVNPNTPDAVCRVTVSTNAHGSMRTCWYLDGRDGVLSSLVSEYEPIPGEPAFLTFWVKFGQTTDPKAKEAGRESIFAELFDDEDWDGRTTFVLDRHSHYICGEKAGSLLFMIPLEERSEGKKRRMAVSCLDVQASVFAADDNDFLTYGVPRALEPTGEVEEGGPLIQKESEGQSRFLSAMAYLSRYLKLAPEIFDYHQFALVTGEYYLFAHRDTPGESITSVVDEIFDEELLKKAFAAVGYDHQFLDQAAIVKDPEGFSAEIRACIDRNTPVILWTAPEVFGREETFSVLVGYDLSTGGAPWKVMKGADETPVLLESPEGLRGAVFSGRKNGQVNLQQFYAEMVRTLPEYLEYLPKNGLKFGTMALDSWIRTLTDGSLSTASEEDFESLYGYHFPMLRKMAAAGTPVLDEILKKCPGFADTDACVIARKAAEVLDQIAEVNREFEEKKLDKDIPPELLNDPEYMSLAEELIRRYENIFRTVLTEIYSTEIRNDRTLWDARSFHVVKVYRQSVADARLIGIRIPASMHGDLSFDDMYRAWQAQEFSAHLSPLLPDEFRAASEDPDALLAMAKKNDRDETEYWIGMLFPEETSVPEGFDSCILPAGELGVAWIRAKEENLFGHEDRAVQNIRNQLGASIPDKDRRMVLRFVPDRFEREDTVGRKVLDVCCYLA
ncbi:MAG: hypothetical protein J5825_07255 [Lachnospiraceae bacterium]|nr:hypothetical protein [Lachnospiraceae bacterium]